MTAFQGYWCFAKHTLYISWDINHYTTHQQGWESKSGTTAERGLSSYSQPNKPRFCSLGKHRPQTKEMGESKPIKKDKEESSEKQTHQWAIPKIEPAAKKHCSSEKKGFLNYRDSLFLTHYFLCVLGEHGSWYSIRVSTKWFLSNDAFKGLSLSEVNRL